MSHTYTLKLSVLHYLSVCKQAYVPNNSGPNSHISLRKQAYLPKNVAPDSHNSLGKQAYVPKKYSSWHSYIPTKADLCTQ